MPRRKRTRKARAAQQAKRDERRRAQRAQAADPRRGPYQSPIPVTRLREGYGGGVYLGYAEFFGGASTWEGLESRLRHYSLEQVLEVLGRLSAVLESDDEGPVEKQHRLVFALFGPGGAPILGRLAVERERSRVNPAHPVAIAIDETSLITVLKAACWTLPPAYSVGDERPLRNLGEALLMANDLSGRSPISPETTGLAARDELQRWAYFITVNALFRHRERQMHWICRAYDLYLTDRIHLRERTADYFDLPALVETATGLPPKTLWAVLFAFLAHFAAIKPATAHSSRAVIHRHRYFSEGFSFTTEEIDRFWSFAARDVEAFSGEMRALYSRADLHPFSALPLSRTPMVLNGEHAFAPYLPEVYAKLTTGIHYLVLDSLPIERRVQFLRYIGEVFEDYITQLFLRAYGGSSGGPRFIDGRTLQAALAPKRGQQPKVCDGMVVDGDAIILLETKAKLLSAAARNGHDSAGFFKKFEEVVVRGARQLDATVAHIQAGRFKSLGIVPAEIQTIYPVLISLQSLPHVVVVPSAKGAPLFAWTDLRLEEEGLLKQSEVRPLQFMEASECEELEVRLHRGGSFRKLLEAKVADPIALRESFQNFFMLRHALAGKPTNAYLAARYQQLTQAALDLFAARRGVPPTEA